MRKSKGPLKKKFKDNTIAKTKKDVNQDKRIVKIEKKVKQMENEVELKYFDTIAASPATQTGLLTLVNGMAAGTTQITRIGAQIRMTSIQFRYVISNLAATLAPTSLRMLIVLDRQTNGAAPTISGSASGGTLAILDNAVFTSVIDQPYQYEAKQRFTILYDKRWTLNPQIQATEAAGAIVTNQIVSKCIQGYVKLNRTVKYDNTTAAISSINTNSLHTVFITDIANGVTLTGGTRIYYKDA